MYASAINVKKYLCSKLKTNLEKYIFDQLVSWTNPDYHQQFHSEALSGFNRSTKVSLIYRIRSLTYSEHNYETKSDLFSITWRFIIAIASHFC